MSCSLLEAVHNKRLLAEVVDHKQLVTGVVYHEQLLAGVEEHEQLLAGVVDHEQLLYTTNCCWLGWGYIPQAAGAPRTAACCCGRKDTIVISRA